jgi:tetratricopeptide (TPR) repeat protein
LNRCVSFSAPLLVLALLVAFTFAAVRNFSFLNYDDNIYITGNPMVTSGLTWNSFRWAFAQSSHAAHWHPLSWLSHMLDCQLFGLDPRYPHLENALFHLLNVGLVFSLIRLATGRVSAAFFVAAIFGLHPMRMESVAWVSERKDVLSLFLGLSSLLLYVGYAQRSGRWRYAGALALFSLSLLAKPTLVTLPLLLLLIDYWPLQRSDGFFARLVEKAPFFLVSTAICIVALWAQHEGGGLRSFSEVTLAARLDNAAVGYLAYLGKLFWPTGFAVFYPMVDYPPGVGAGAVFALAFLTVMAFRARRQEPALFVGWGWFLISLLPMIGLLQIGGQAFADRWTYFPHIGLLLAVAFLVDGRVRSPAARLWLAPCATALIVACLALTYFHLPQWKDSVALFSHTLEVSPNNFIAHTNLGSELDHQGRLAAAAEHYEAAVRLNPTYPEALNNLGTLRARMGRVTEAAALFRRALDIRGDFTDARYNLGLAKDSLGSHLQAISEWLEVLAQDPGYHPAQGSLAFVTQHYFEKPCDQWLPLRTEAEQSVEEKLVAQIRNRRQTVSRAGLEKIAACIAARTSR